MSLNTIRQALEERFRDNWTQSDVDTGVRYSNAVYNPQQGSNWASIDIRWLPTQKPTISTNMPVRRRGLLVVDCYAPIDTGAGKITEMGDEVLGIFENTQFPVGGDEVGTYVQFGSSDIRHIGVPNIQGTDPMWYKLSIRLVFYRDE